MTAWCDVAAPWPLTPASADDSAGLALSVAGIHAIVRQLEADGVPAERIVLAGFSQGAATATLATYAYPRRLGGCVNLSGWLPARDQFAAAVVAAQGGGANASTPCFWGHGTDDEIVAFANQAAGAAAMAAAGVSVDSQQYAIGHDTNEAEMDAVLQFLQKQLA